MRRSRDLSDDLEIYLVIWGVEIATLRNMKRGRFCNRPLIAKLGIVNEESDETVYWLELMRDSGIGDRRDVGLLLPEAKELRAIFASSYATAKRNRGK